MPLSVRAVRHLRERGERREYLLQEDSGAVRTVLVEVEDLDKAPRWARKLVGDRDSFERNLLALASARPRAGLRVRLSRQGLLCSEDGYRWEPWLA
jgi:hypothetical protein